LQPGDADSDAGNQICNSSSTDVVYSSCEDHAQDIKSVSNLLKKKKLPYKSKSDQPPKKQRVRSNEKEVSPSVSLSATYKLPNRFRPDIQAKLDDPSSVFMPNDQSAFLREVANSVQLHTLRPSAYEMNNIVNRVLEKYPHISTFTSEEAKHVSTTRDCINLWLYFAICSYLKGDVSYKLKRILERRRASGNSLTLTKTKLNGNHCGPNQDLPVQLIGDRNY
jgi:hypothetical protein